MLSVSNTPHQEVVDRHIEAVIQAQALNCCQALVAFLTSAIDCADIKTPDVVSRFPATISFKIAPLQL